MRSPMVSPPVEAIAQLNDRFRRFDSTVPGKRVITAGIAGLLTQLDVPMEMLVHHVIHFDDFTEANDPHGEPSISSCNGKMLESAPC